MTDQLLIATIAGQRIALRTSSVQSMIEVESVTPVPRTPSHIAGLSALRSRILTVIDCRQAIGLASSDRGATKSEAIAVEHSGHFYALLVDGVEDVVEACSTLLPIHADIGTGWERVALGMIETDSGTLMLVDAVRFITGHEELAVN